MTQQLLVESLVLAATGGLLGVALAFAGVQLIVSVAPVDLPRIDEVHVDGRVLAFTLALSV